MTGRPLAFVTVIRKFADYFRVDVSVLAANL
jgi:hypothetical protein